MTRLLGGGVSASNVSQVGDARQFATFNTASATDVGFGSGVIMSTGIAAQAAGPNTLDNPGTSGTAGTSTVLSRPGDASVAAAAGTTTAQTRDAAVLQFDFVPNGDQITFNYVFASEEYPEYAKAGFNDAFTFLVNGVACASVPGTTTPVSINNVNRTTNASQYRDNALYAPGSTVRRTAPVNVAYDGLTKVFSCTAAVREGEANRVKLAIADVTDGQLDSAVFLQANSFTPYVNVPPVIGLPSTIAAEARDAMGTPVTYAVSATDDRDGTVPATCTPASGSTFAVGTTKVTCTARDSRGLTATGSFDVVVGDTTAPVLALPHDLRAEAEGPNGAAVDFDASAADSVDGTTPVTCDHETGDTFALGDTTVTCRSSDGRGNTSTGSFVVTVADTTAPALTVPPGQVLEATGPRGAQAAFDATATDVVDGSVTPVCSFSSGDTFDLGDTGVVCTATDAAGNVATGSFSITVVDTTAPVITVPEDRTIEATGPEGAVGDVEATAVDVVDGALPVTCERVSDSPFALGSTRVACVSTDAAGNRAEKSFTVTVVDTTAPAITVPDDRTVEATGPGGSTSDFETEATDLVDGPLPVTCDQPSGSSFALGSTRVACVSTDAAGNRAGKSFTVTVVDTTAPTLTLPDDLATTYAGPGTTRSWSATATDLVDGTTAVTCDRPSGSTFPVGSTTVTCTSVDSRGNTATGSFSVDVTYAWDRYAQPINDTGHSRTDFSVFKAGSTVPVKFSLLDAAGRPFQAAAAPVWLAPQKGAATSQPIDETVYTLPASTGTRFSFDGSKYQYNWATSKSMAGSYWRLATRLDDGTTHYAVIALR